MEIINFVILNVECFYKTIKLNQKLLYTVIFLLFLIIHTCKETSLSGLLLCT